MRWLSWIIARLGHPTACRFILALALVLALPSLASPLVMDEYAQLLRYRESTEPHAPSFLNTAFLFADPANRQRDLESVGMWWMAPDLKIAFWRPLAAFTQLIDFRLWPSSALLMHVHTLVWFALSLLAVAALYQRFLSQAAANLALAMYAWDDARGQLRAMLGRGVTTFGVRDLRETGILERHGLTRSWINWVAGQFAARRWVEQLPGKGNTSPAVWKILPAIAEGGEQQEQEEA